MIPHGSILQEEGATHVRGVEPQVRSSSSCLLGHRPCSQVLQLPAQDCWIAAQNSQVLQPSWVAAQIVRFSKLPSWVTAPLAPGGAGRQRERLLWSCCDQGSAPAAGWRSWRPRPGGVVRLECCRAGAAPPSSGGAQGARARHLLLLKACCLRNNRCTRVGKQGQRTRSTLS